MVVNNHDFSIYLLFHVLIITHECISCPTDRRGVGFPISGHYTTRTTRQCRHAWCWWKQKANKLWERPNKTRTCLSELCSWNFIVHRLRDKFTEHAQATLYVYKGGLLFKEKKTGPQTRLNYLMLASVGFPQAFQEPTLPGDEDKLIRGDSIDTFAPFSQINKKSFILVGNLYWKFALICRASSAAITSRKE